MGFICHLLNAVLQQVIQHCKSFHNAVNKEVIIFNVQNTSSRLLIFLEFDHKQQQSVQNWSISTQFKFTLCSMLASCWNICLSEQTYSSDWCFVYLIYVWSVSRAYVSYLLRYAKSWLTHHSVGGCAWWLAMRKVMAMRKDTQTK